MENIKVSISCITFNQAKYIAKAIDSFLMQKTNFEYEILIHDDASTDGTAEIIRAYQEKYPNKIFPVFQTENQYSKGVKISYKYLYPKYRGKYVAVCEGDDYWTDEYKLQKQFDYMEEHPNCGLCIHGAIEVKEDSEITIAKDMLSDKIEEYEMIDAIKGIGRKVATNSFFYRKELCMEMPEWRLKAPCDDYIIPIMCAKNGSIAYLPQIMSAHRAAAISSMNLSWKKEPEKRKVYNQRFDEMLKGIDQYTDCQYSDLLKQESIRNWFYYYVQIKDKKALRSQEYISFRKKLPFKKKLYTFLDLNIPWSIVLLRRAKHFLLELFRKR